MKDQACRAILVDRLFAASPDVVTLNRTIRTVLHRLSRSFAEGAGSGDYLHLLAEIIEKLQASDATGVIMFCFEADVFKLLCARPVSDAIREGTMDRTKVKHYSCSSFIGLGSFLAICAATGGDDVQQLLATFAGQWILTLRGSLDNSDEEQVRTSIMKYLHEMH